MTRLVPWLLLAFMLQKDCLLQLLLLFRKGVMQRRAERDTVLALSWSCYLALLDST